MVYPQSSFTIDAVTHSYKYGNELQFKSYTFKPPTLEHRVDKDHTVYRLECGYLPLTHGTAEQLRRVADQIDLIIDFQDKKEKPFKLANVLL